MAKTIKQKIVEVKKEVKNWWDEKGKAYAIAGVVVLVPSALAGALGYAEGKKRHKISSDEFGQYVDDHTNCVLRFGTVNDQKKAEMWLYHDDGTNDVWRFPLDDTIKF